MKNVVAFVAKSYLPEDAEVVAEIETFLKQFEQRGLHCIDASQGKEGSLSGKVVARLDDAQAFIGILTRRHHVLRSKRETRKALPLIERVTSPVAWATSAWTLQESGFAVARKFKLVLIVEDGVTDIGQLHGDPVIVRFDRTNVSGCFTELAGQVMSLISEKAAASEVPPTEKDVTETPPAPPAKPPRREGARRWEKVAQFHEALWAKPPKYEEAEAAYQEAKKLAANDDERDLVEVTYRDLCLEVGAYGAYEAFREAVESHPTMRGLTQLGRYVASTGEHQRALELFDRALAAPALGFSRSSALTAKSLSLHALSRIGDARASLLADLGDMSVHEIERARLATSMADLAKRDSAGDDEAAWLEHALSLRPDDHETRFRLAYLYSALGNDPMALFHYEKLTTLNPTEATFNNIGVSRTNLDLPSLGVAAYKRASEMGNSLAMANRASRLMDLGFLREAEAVLDESSALEHPHENIASVRAQITAKEKAEEEKEKSILTDAEAERQFHAHFGRTRVMPGPDGGALVGVWRTDWGNIAVAVTGNKLSGRGEGEGTAKELHESFYQLVLLRMGSGEARLRRVVTLDGTVEGNSGWGVMSKKLYREGGSADPLQEEKLHVRFAADGNHVQVLEVDEKEKTRQLKRYAVPKPAH